MAVYVVRCGDRVKIGESSYPAQRIAGLRTMSPYPLEVVGAWKGKVDPWDGKASDKVSERAMHRELVQWHTHGEWFQLDQAGEERLAELIEQMLGEPVRLRFHETDRTGTPAHITVLKPVRSSSPPSLFLSPPPGSTEEELRDWALGVRENIPSPRARTGKQWKAFDEANRILGFDGPHKST